VVGAPADPIPNPHPPEGMEKTVAAADARERADFVTNSATGGRD